MFGRKRKNQTDGQICPLCQLLNAEEAESCTRCYYEFTVAAHRQTVSEITTEESDDLFDALLNEEEEADEESPLVDWTGHSFSMDDMTVEVSQYDEGGLVEVDQSVSMDHQFDARFPSGFLGHLGHLHPHDLQRRRHHSCLDAGDQVPVLRGNLDGLVQVYAGWTKNVRGGGQTGTADVQEAHYLGLAVGNDMLGKSAKSVAARAAGVDHDAERGARRDVEHGGEEHADQRQHGERHAKHQRQCALVARRCMRHFLV